MKKIWLFRPDTDDGLKITTALSKMFDVGLITSNTASKKKFIKNKKFKKKVIINEEILNLSHYKKFNIDNIPSSKVDYKNFYTAMQVMERNERFMSELSFEERNYIIHKHYAFWKSKIEREKPKYVIFFDIPHMYYELIIISILKEKKIPLIIMYRKLGFTLFLDKNLNAINIGEGRRLDQLKNQYIERIFNKKKIKHNLVLNKQTWFVKDILFLLKQILKIPIKFFLSYVLNRIEFNSKYIKLKNYEFGKNSIFNENITNIKNILKRLIIKNYYNFTSKKNIDLENEKYIYFPLVSHYECHYHPASSPSNFLMLLENLLSKIPKNIKVFIKEHPRQFAWRGQQKFSKTLGFYKKIKNFKNVEYVDIKMDNTELIKNSQYVFCSSLSTISLECISNKKKLINYGVNIFEQKYSHHIKDIIGIKSNMKMLARKEKKSKNLFFPEHYEFDISKNLMQLTKTNIESISKRLTLLIKKS
jgi:hypothetical protein